MLVKVAQAQAKVREAMEAEKTSGKQAASPTDTAPATAPPVDGSAETPQVATAAAQADLFPGPSRLSDGTPIEEAILAAGDGELPVPPRVAWQVIGVRAGELASHLVQHAAADGPRHDARPA